MKITLLVCKQAAVKAAAEVEAAREAALAASTQVSCIIADVDKLAKCFFWLVKNPFSHVHDIVHAGLFNEQSCSVNGDSKIQLMLTAMRELPPAAALYH